MNAEPQPLEDRRRHERTLQARTQGRSASVRPIEESWASDESLAARAQNNDFQNFRLVFDRTFLDTVVRRMDDNEEIFKRILDEPEFRQTMLDHYAVRLYERFRAEHDEIRISETP